MTAPEVALTLVNRINQDYGLCGSVCGQLMAPQPICACIALRKDSRQALWSLLQNHLPLSGRELVNGHEGLRSDR